MLNVRDRYDVQRCTQAALAAQQRRQRTDLAARKASIEARIAHLTRMRVAAYGSAGPRLSAGSLAGLKIPLYTGAGAGRALAFALAQRGKPYVWGSAGPDGYDRSSLTLAAWQVGGVALPHNAAMQWTLTAHVTRDRLRPGDLVFYFSDIHHVALYVGAGKVIHAPKYGEDVTVTGIDLGPIYGYGRPD